jgi:hypothetical protein
MGVLAARRVLSSAVALLLGLGVLIHGALPAQACTCAQPDPYSSLSEAAGGFIGTLIATSRGLPVEDTGTLIDYEFEVETVLKGDIGEVVTVKSAADGGACGLEMPVGERVGLLLRQSGDEWQGDLCWTFDADILLAASQGLPDPLSGSPPHVIASAYLGEAGLVALDADGQIVGYGRGRPAWLMDACPDDATFIGIGDGTVVRTWSFTDLGHVRDYELGSNAAGGYYNLACAGHDDFIVLSAREQVSDLPDLVLTQVTGGHAEILSEDVETLIETKNELLAIDSDGVINRIDTQSGSLISLTDSIGDVQGKIAAANPSPDGRYLAVTLVDWSGPTVDASLVVSNLETGESSSVATDCDVYPGWLDPESLSVTDCTTGRYSVYDKELDLIGPGPGPGPAGFSTTAIDEAGTAYVPVANGIERVPPGADHNQAWAMLATHPNQVIVVPEGARDGWVGNEFAPRPPAEMTPYTAEPVEPVPAIAPTIAEEPADAPAWLIVAALAIVSIVLGLIIRRSEAMPRDE